jgi:hypothetical protein
LNIAASRRSQTAPLKLICHTVRAELRGSMHKLKVLLIGATVAISLGAAMIHLLTSILIAS